MNRILKRIYRKQSLFYKAVLFIATVYIIVYFFPKGGQFKFDVQKGKPWQYETLYAPFDFAIYKTEDSLAIERKAIIEKRVDYYQVDRSIEEAVKKNFNNLYTTYLNDTIKSPETIEKYRQLGLKIIGQLYRYGLSDDVKEYPNGTIIGLVTNNNESKVLADAIVKEKDIPKLVESNLESEPSEVIDAFTNLFLKIARPNVFFDEELTDKVMNTRLQNILETRGAIEKGTKIIAAGEVVEGERFLVLSSLKREYQSQLWNTKNERWMLLGYALLVGLNLFFLLIFLQKYRPEVYTNNNKVTFVFFNIVVVILLTIAVVKFNFEYVYAVPICILPLILKAFFDPRLGLFAHVLTVLVLGFVVPNGFEYVFLQIIAGIATIQTITELHKRANLFLSVAQITFVYITAYFAISLVQEGGVEALNWSFFGIFVVNGLATLAAFPLIYMYEKLFGLVSDVSLLELSDTNSKLLKELSDKAPGTFHHSLQVANLAEAVSNDIGANAMLVRVGALYHDIGKMNNPMYFTENQTTSVNPHDELTPAESAQLIINHVLEGIEIAKKNKLPDRVIDFIRTHHGTTLVYYFYKKELETNKQVNLEDFQYKGPTPFSKETAVLMMTDAVEAASRSLKNPTFTTINDFVEKIIDKQIEENQFVNANITFKEIVQIKKVLKQKLTNIYHLRVEYPE